MAEIAQSYANIIKKCSENKRPILNLHFQFLFVETRHELSLRSIATKRSCVNGDFF